MDRVLDEPEIAEIVAGVRAGRYTLAGGPSYSGWRVSVENGRVVGIVTNRDLRFETNLDQPVRNIMTPQDQLVTVREGESSERIKALLHQHRIEKVLVIDDEFHLKGLITVNDFRKAELYPNACKDEQGRLRVGAAVGTGVPAAGTGGPPIGSNSAASCTRSCRSWA